VRRFLRHGFPYFLVLLFAVLVFVQGCARPVLQTYPAGENEIEAVSKAFERYQETSRKVCGCCLDAEADAALSVSSWFRDHTGKLSGYLQAMEPGYIKFIAVNPLGQPLFILVTNGEMFQGLNVFEKKVYVGSVHSATYKKFAPPGLEPEFLFYWLTGRLQPGEMVIQAVMRDREQDAFWLQIKYADSGTDSMVLFDLADQVILRHVLRDERGSHLVDILYADYQSLPGKESQETGNDPAEVADTAMEKRLCRVPARIVLSSNMNAEKVEVKLHSFLDEADFTAADFYLKNPGSFEQLLVK
jgi:hypothetical protein